MQLQMVLPEGEQERYQFSGDATNTRPSLEVPSGYRLRTYAPTDDAAYIALMRRGGFAGWDKTLLQMTLTQMLPGGLYFIEHLATHEIVATTVAGHVSSKLHPAGAELGWVAVDPAHRGKRLGAIVCDAVIRRFAAAGYTDIYLKTDDFRLPAIKTYLNCGFRPLILDREMVERWNLVAANLKLSPSTVEDLAVRTVDEDTGRLGYVPWNSAKDSAPLDIIADTAAPDAEPVGHSSAIRIGMLPLFLDLYDIHRPDLRGRMEEFLQKIRTLLGGTGSVIVEAPIATKHSDIEAAERRFSNSIDLLVTVHLAYSPSLLVADYLSRCGVPILMLDSTPRASFDLESPRYIPENHGVHGVMDLSSVLYGRDVPFRIVAGHPDDSRFRSRVIGEIEARRMARRFRDSRIGVTGTPFVGMGDFAIRRDAVAERFGIETVNVAPEAILAAMESIAQVTIDEMLSFDREHYDTSGVAVAAHERELRAYAAIRSICDAESLSGYTMNFEHTGKLQPPFYACSRLMADGLGYAGEGDVITAALGAAFGALGAPSMFSEIFCVDWENDEILFSHMGEVDPGFAGSTVKLMEKKALGHEESSIYFRFDAKAMPITLANLGLTEGVPSRLVISKFDMLERSAAPGIAAPHFFGRASSSVSEFLESYAHAGGGHHLYLCEGDQREVLRAMSEHLGIACLEVG